MTHDAEGPHAHLAVVAGERSVPIGPCCTDSRTSNLELLDDVLRLELALRRLGWHVRLSAVHPELRELIALAGLADRLDVDGER